MKQIFDWLREQYMQRKALWEDKSVADRFSAEKHIGTWNKALELLDAAEAKWESEHKPYDVENVVSELKKHRAKFDCRVCKYNKTETQVCTKDCTDALIDNLLEIVRKGGVE